MVYDKSEGYTQFSKYINELVNEFMRTNPRQFSIVEVQSEVFESVSFIGLNYTCFKDDRTSQDQWGALLCRQSTFSRGAASIRHRRQIDH